MKNQTISEDIAPRRCGIAVLSVMLHTVSELWDMTNRIVMGLWDMMIAV